MDNNTTKTKGAPRNGSPSTLLLKYIKNEAIRFIHPVNFLDSLMLAVVLIDGVVIGRAL